MHYFLHRTIAGATIAAWFLLAADAVPGVSLGPAQVFIAVTAGVGAIVLAITSTSRPVTEVWEAGFEAGRRQAKIEESTERAGRSRVVVPFRSQM